MIESEKGTLFSALLSQRNVWTIQQVLDLSESIAAPFSELTVSELETSNDVSMLMDIINILPYKLSLYKCIVDDIYKDNGMSCDELDLNVFNADCGLDSIAFLVALKNKGYNLDNIKAIRLFSTNTQALRRALLLHKYLFPTLKVISFDLDLNSISTESKCDSLLTINLFPCTYSFHDKVAKSIGDLLINSHQLYSHSIFFEFVDTDEVKSIPSLDCSYFWQDIQQTKFSKNPPKEFTFKPRSSSDKSPKLQCSSKYCIFSTTSLDDLLLSHEYKIVLSDLCPGSPSRALFNEKQNLLFFDKPLETSSDFDNLFDSETIVATEVNVIDLSIKEFSILDAIKSFPQYQIADALNKKEEWAISLFNFYLERAENNNFKCYNNLAILLLLKDCQQDDIDNLDSPRNKEIIKFLLLAIEGGDTDAMINLASLYMSKGKHEDAIKYYDLAFKKGSACGAFSIAVANHFGLCGFTVNKSIAIDCYRKFFDLLKIERESDSNNYAPESQNCLNLIILMYEMDYSLCDITKEYNKVKKPSERLIYAYTVISNNLSNRAKDLFPILKLSKSEEDEPSYVTYNRLCALHNGVVCGDNKLSSNPSEALEKLKSLAETRCPDWPEWERYVWATLANWTCKSKDDSSLLASTFWLKAIQANPSKECAYQTNIAIFGNISDEEKKSIWNKFTFGNGCPNCHECNNYDETTRCCPKAQLRWVRTFETDSSVADFLLNHAIAQNYVNALEEKAINRIYKESQISVSPIDLYAFNWGRVPHNFLTILDKFSTSENIALLWKATNLGSRRAASLLLKILESENSSDYEYYFLAALNSNYIDRTFLFKTLSKKSLTNGYFEPSSLIEIDYLNAENKIAEQFIGSKEVAFGHLQQLAEYYFDGEFYYKALRLYKIALEKEFDVSKRISEIETIIEKEEAEARSYRSYGYDDDDYHDYGRDTWDALTDGMYGDYPGSGVDYDFLGFD